MNWVGPDYFGCLDATHFDFVACNCQLHKFPSECIHTEIFKDGMRGTAGYRWKEGLKASFVALIHSNVN